MESFTLELCPHKGPVYLGLFENVTNSSGLKQRLEEQDPTLNCTFVNAAMVINSFHALLAVNRAVLSEQRNKMKTHSLQSEIIFDFSHTTNITKTLAQFGMQDQVKNVLAIVVGGTAVEAESSMKKYVQGEMVSIDHLNTVRDLALIEQVYQIKDQSQQPDRILELVAGSMALKGH